MEGAHRHRRARLLVPAFAVGCAVALCAPRVHAHVKWFVPFDITNPPVPIGQVLTGRFVTGFLLSVVAIYVFFLVDRTLYKRRYLSALDERLRQFDRLATAIMRGCACVFLASLWYWHYATGTGFFLTPELKTTSAIVPWVQLAMAACLLWKPTAPLAGLGVIGLFAAAVGQYGGYHMLDYPIFLGIGYFLLISNAPSPAWRRSGFIVLFAATGITLAWASIEKFGYPEWTFPVLEKNPDMLMGMTPEMFMMVSGFVEFFLAFTVLGAASVIGRLVAFGFQGIFVLAVFKFGALDAVGHLMIVAILTVLVVRGPTSAREMLVLRDKLVWTEAYFMTGLYFLAFVMSFILYYGVHVLVYGV